MKLVVGFVVLMAVATAGFYYASVYTMGAMEAGMPGGGNGQYSDYHDGNLINEYLSEMSGDVATTTEFTAGNVSASSFTAGDVTSNPYAD
jgi:hypothetical protein